MFACWFGLIWTSSATTVFSALFLLGVMVFEFLMLGVARDYLP